MKIYRLVIVIALMGLATTSFGQTESYSQKVKTMLRLNGTMETFRSSLTMILNSYKSAYSNVSEEAWQELEQEFRSASLDDLVEMLVPVYHKYLSEDDLDAIIAFYRTPAGKKLADSTPDIMRDSMKVGQEWGKAVGEKVAGKLQGN